MTIEIRELTVEDIEKSIDVIKEITELHIDKAPGQFQAIKLEDYRLYLQWIISSPQNFGYVAVKGGEVVGAITVTEQERVGNVFTVNRYYEVIDLVVKKTCRHLGIGRLLLDKVAEKARLADIPAIELQVFRFNRTALEFYKHLGFDEVATVMELKLDR